MRNLLRVGLRKLVTHAQVHPIGDRHATVIAVATQKGGVGKTTTSVSLAAALARSHGQRVLLIDLDPQGHVATALRAQVRPGGGKLSEVLTDEQQAKEVMDITVSTTITNLDLTPYDPDLGRAEDLLGTRIGKECILRDALRITRTHYDVIVIDCPPNAGNLTLNGLVAADQVIIPCDASPLALKGVNAVVNMIATIAARLNPEIDVLGILFTRIDGRNTTLNQAILSEIREGYGDAVLPVQIGISGSLAKAQLQGVDIYESDPSSRGAKHYAQLADHVTQMLMLQPGS